MTKSLVFSKHCPNCGGDVQFGITLDGPVLKCVQCTRIVSADQAKELLAQLQAGQREPEPIAVGAEADGDVGDDDVAVAASAGADSATATAVGDRRIAA